MLNEILDLVENEGVSSGDIVRFTVVEQPEKMTLDLNFELPRALKSIEKTQELVRESSLWKFLREEIPVTSIDIFPEGIYVCCGAYFNMAPDSFSERALEAYHQQKGFSEAENEGISQFLHDLKNQLIAYQISLESPSTDRTSSLRGRYEASQHLDRARSICLSLEAIGQAISLPVAESLDVGDFFRQYIAQKMTTVPSNIRISPPKTVGNCQVGTAPDFLRSIIDNLVRNSIEAMPDGGEIRLDWVFDHTEKSLLIEIADTGPGIDEALLERLLAGKTIESAKKVGSGIGMFTVTSMLRRMGGTLTAETAPGRGTCWVITLPSVEEIAGPDDSVELGDMEQIVAIEKEVDPQ